MLSTGQLLRKWEGGGCGGEMIRKWVLGSATDFFPVDWCNRVCFVYLLLFFSTLFFFNSIPWMLFWLCSCVCSESSWTSTSKQDKMSSAYFAQSYTSVFHFSFNMFTTKSVKRMEVESVFLQQMHSPTLHCNITLWHTWPSLHVPSSFYHSTGVFAYPPKQTIWIYWETVK